MRLLSSPALALAGWLLVSLATGCDQGSFGGASGKQASKSRDSKKTGANDGDDDDSNSPQQRTGTGTGTNANSDGQDDGKDGGTDAGTKDDAQSSDDDAKPPVPVNDPSAAIDEACLGGVKSAGKPPIAPPTPSLPKTAPDGCRGGVEFNNLEGSSFKLVAHGTINKSAPLEVDVASYTAEDHMRVIAETTAGDQTIIDTCRLRTAEYADPTGGLTRPPENSIRGFRIKAPKGTTALRFDWTDTRTPTYMRVIGLCDFDTTASNIGGKSPNLRPVSN